MNTEERQLAELLHRVTPEPPRRVTVEDIAYRVASESRGSGRGRAPRPHRGFSFGSRRWAPALAALSVVAIAGATVGIATVANSHHGNAPAAGGTPTSSAPTSASSAPYPSSTSPPLRIADGMWGATLINRESFEQESLVSSAGSLYAFNRGSLLRIDPATGQDTQATPYGAPVPGRPVIVGNTVWVVWAYSGGEITLHGYDARTLARVASVSVPAIGGVASSAQGVLTAGTDGKLYVAAGQAIAVVNPANGDVSNRVMLTEGRASSIAVAPDGSKLYVGVATASSFRLLIYDTDGRVTGSSTMTGGPGGNLVATSGGVWGTAGSGMSEWVWFAPGGDLGSSSRVTQGAGGGLYSWPSLSGGVVWIGGSDELICASPATGKALARTALPTDHNVVEYFGSPAVLDNGHAYSLYQDQHAQLTGVARLTPPAACTGG